MPYARWREAQMAQAVNRPMARRRRRRESIELPEAAAAGAFILLFAWQCASQIFPTLALQ